jgi:Uma2 family endonuclease
MLDPRELAPEVPRLITRAEFRKLAETDLFDEDERIELIRGVLVRVNPPLPHPSHDATIRRLNRLLTLAVGTRAWVSSNLSFAAGDYSQTIPDLAIVPDGTYEADFPGEAWLLVEVALTSLSKDRKIKAPLYAECAVPEYWIVDLEGQAIEVYTEPKDGAYTSVVRRTSGEQIRLVRLPDVEVAVEDVLGRRE